MSAVRSSSGIRPNAWSKKCASPMTLTLELGATRRRSSAFIELSPSLRTIRSGCCSSMIRDSSATEPSRAVSPGSSSTAPTTAKGAWPSNSTASATASAQLDVPTTSTRRLPTTRCAMTSQIVVSVKTETPRARIVESSMPIPGIQRATADTPTSPVAVPTAQRTGAPSVRCTAANALRSEISQTAVRSDAAPTATPAPGTGDP